MTEGLRPAPERITILRCPRCGRNDLYTPFTGKYHACYLSGEYAKTPHSALEQIMYVREAREKVFG